MNTVDPKTIKSKRAKQRILAMMEQYEKTHTHEEGRRMWGRLVEILESSKRGAAAAS